MNCLFETRVIGIMRVIMIRNIE